MRRTLVAYLGGLLLLFAIWELLSLALGVFFSGPAAKAFPPPGEALVALAQNWKTLGAHFAASGLRVLVSLVLAIGIAGPLGLVIGHEPALNRWLSPLIYVTYPIPKVVFLPVLFLLLGLEDAPKITLIALVVAFQVLLSARDAAQNIPAQHVLSVRSAGAGRLQVYRHVVVPAALPAILSSARVSVGLAIAALYLAETFSTRYGLGKYINEAYGIFGFSRMFAGIMAMGLLGLVFYALLDGLERWLCRWKYR